MARLLGLDIGTTSAKAIVIDERGDVLQSASRAYPLVTPRPGWCEQDPDDWWRATQECLDELASLEPDAIGLTGQMHGSVFLDRGGQVIRPAILWNDQRTTRECEEMLARLGRERILSTTCNPPMTGFQVPKVLWLRSNEPESFHRVHNVLLPKDFIRFRLTGQLATDVTDASGTGVFDVPNRRWSVEMLEALDLPPSFFPPAHESTSQTGATLPTTGLRAGVPVAAGGGDQAAGAVGTGAVVPGLVSVSLGTSGVVFAPLAGSSYDPNGNVHTFCHANGAWHAMSVMLSCGGAVEWFRTVAMPGASLGDFDALAAEAPVGADGLTFLPYLTGERSPHPDPIVRAAFMGLSIAHGSAHLARAVLEGVTFGLLDGLSALRGLGVHAEELRVTGGGARSDLWLRLLASATGKPCLRLALDEGPAFGAAILAGVAIGVWPDVVAATRECVRISGRIEPSGDDLAPAYERYRRGYPAVRQLARDQAATPSDPAAHP